MRKIIYLSLFSVVLLFTACFDEVDNWYSNTSSYDGRFSVATSCEEDETRNTPIEALNELLIYNSAANVENEIWIDSKLIAYFDEDDEPVQLPIKGKFLVTGNSLEFVYNGQDVVNENRHETINGADYFLQDPDDGYWYSASDLSYYVPTEAGEVLEAFQYFTRVKLESGKIIPGGATTIGGNVADKVILKVTVYSDELQFVSREIDPSKWATPGEPEYEWVIKAGSRKNAEGSEEHWTLEGYRYSGYPEDL